MVGAAVLRMGVLVTPGFVGAAVGAAQHRDGAFACLMKTVETCTYLPGFTSTVSGRYCREPLTAWTVSQVVAVAGPAASVEPSPIEIGSLIGRSCDVISHRLRDLKASQSTEVRRSGIG
jgi:hypothetical protein